MNADLFALLQIRLESSNSAYDVRIIKTDEVLPGRWTVQYDCTPKDPSGMLGARTMVRLSLVSAETVVREENSIILGYRS